ncbi:hypothetical protein HPB51_022348 [Rhipicephalus microplus]|uniref:Uncharacterized protein n=1 Tax=Rhipicephalus microplus TaxID=6941 RepID=A0A9J6EUY6_RHIMP|nr:hypothetical protein HPB51_022348 [Rhipicephalus microplus]
MSARQNSDSEFVFNASLWDYNSAEVPTVQFVYKRAHLFHRVYDGLHTHSLPNLYLPHFIPDWRNAYALHTLVNHRGYVPQDPLFGVGLNETNIRDYDTAFGQMARSVLFGTSDFVDHEAAVLSVAQLATMKHHGIDSTQIHNGSFKPFYVVN